MSIHGVRPRPVRMTILLIISLVVAALTAPHVTQANPQLGAVRITVTDLDTLGGSDSEARDINEHGQIVGTSETATGERHAVLWTISRLSLTGVTRWT
ncbi:MAG: hypothetical protein M3R24_23000 [Chloroflexota bacterium]|nr:hypothetical protein [Chloroflexota bacterium]